MTSPQPLLAIVGPTGSGKSAIAVELALQLEAQGVAAEIVSADAMQLYAGMDIGTAKVTSDESRGVTHHLLDVWSVDQEASVQDYQRRAREAIEDCFARAVLPILVGGSGLYVSSVIYQFEFPGTDEALRATLETQAENEGLESLVQQLLERDPGAAESVDLKNPRRVIRALEILQLTGEAQTPGLEARGQWWHEPTLIVGIDWPRDTLVERIDARVQQMWERGLVDEVKSLQASHAGLGKTASQAIGYREVIQMLAGEISEDEARDQVAQHTRRYARKQMSWFRRDQNVHWLKPQSRPVVATVIQALEALWPGLTRP